MAINKGFYIYGILTFFCLSVSFGAEREVLNFTSPTKTFYFYI